jgi:Holliday junction resolvase
LTPEGKVKKEVIAYLNERGAYYFMPVTGGYGRSGVPDIVACLNGKFVGIECKAGDNQPTALQVKNLKAIRSAGGLSFCVNSVKLLREQLESDLEGLE